jgi:hypothetical protein
MKRLESRIRKLEEDLPPGRCSHCRDWPPPRIVIIKEGDPIPERPYCHCPECGWTFDGISFIEYRCSEPREPVAPFSERP